LITRISQRQLLQLGVSREPTDLDAALLLAHDQPDGLRYEASLVHPATPCALGLMMCRGNDGG